MRYHLLRYHCWNIKGCRDVCQRSYKLLFKIQKNQFKNPSYGRIEKEKIALSKPEQL